MAQVVAKQERGLCRERLEERTVGPDEEGRAAEKEEQWRIWAAEEVAAPARRVWKVVSQFCSAHLWAVNLETCERVEGQERVVGCLRLCKGSSDFSASGLGGRSGRPAGACGLVAQERLPKQAAKNWSLERLLLLDDAEMVLAYEVLDSNLGLRGYSASFQVVPASADPHGSCTLRWSAALDPLPFSSRERIACLFCTLFHRNVQALRILVSTSH